MSDTASLLWKAVSPVFITMGTFGNVLCITVLMQPSNRKSSTAVFLTALAISDLFVLYTGKLLLWVVLLLFIIFALTNVITLDSSKQEVL